jgi:drug/metabolite transporter (DMT)-like permease
MGTSGAAWAGYSILGKNSIDPVLDTTGNFMPCFLLSLLLIPYISDYSLEGVMYAVASGGFASGVGYVLWYVVIGQINAVTAALVQLSIPILTIIGAWIVLKEEITLRLVVSGCIVIFGLLYSSVNVTRRHGSDV